MDQKHSISMDLGHENLDWESFWNENQAAISQELAAGMQPFFDLHEDDYDLDARANILAEKMQKEKEFARLLLPKLQELLTKSKKILMLVDVDETIGGNYYDRQEVKHTVIRPAFLAILKKLQAARENGRLEVGLLTTRKSLQQQLNEPENLHSIKDYVDFNHLYSAQAYGFEGGTFDALKDIGERKNSLLRPGLADEDYEYFCEVDSIQKLMALENITKQNPNEYILVVDDAGFVNYLNPERNLHGVHINNKATFAVG